MNKIKFSIGLFAVLAVAQISVPVYMIWHRETTLHDGRQFRFQTAPVDPYDAFRGRYVALQMAQNSAPITGDEKFAFNQKVIAHLEEDDKGFARIVKVTSEQPAGDAHVQCRVSTITDSLVFLQFPFDRYYMDEEAAPAAEAAYFAYSRREVQDVYVTVRVKDGFAVVEELYIAGMPIKEFLSKNPE